MQVKLRTIVGLAVAAVLGGLAFASPSYAAPPGRDGAISFVRNGNLKTVVLSQSSYRERPVISDGSIASARWSPSGEQLTYSLKRSGGGIGVVSATGERRRLLVRSGFVPTWSPDGKHIAYVSGNDIWTVSTAGGPPARLTRESAKVCAVDWPTWSPDGTKIAYVRFNSYLGADCVAHRGGTLVVRTLKTGATTAVKPNNEYPAGSSPARFTANSRGLAYVAVSTEQSCDDAALTYDVQSLTYQVVQHAYDACTGDFGMSEVAPGPSGGYAFVKRGADPSDDSSYNSCLFAVDGAYHCSSFYRYRYESIDVRPRLAA